MRMVLLIVHHHFRPGGVRRVIEVATPALVEHWPEPVRLVRLVSGEAPEAGWLRHFRRELRGTRVDVVIEPALGYLADQRLTGERLQQRLSAAVRGLLDGGWGEPVLVWAHNLGLGRNPYLSRELTLECDRRSTLLVAHHHDWWFENRWQHYAALREPGFRRLDAMADAVLGNSGWIIQVAINRADAAVLGRHYPGLSGWLPNPVDPGNPPARERVDRARRWFGDRLGEEAPVWLVPARLLRRKNLAEALLLTRWLRPEAWLVTTGGASSAEERAYADALAEAARAHGWRLRLGILAAGESTAPQVSELMGASEAVLLTSLQEGFGLPYLEAVAVRRPLIARRVPLVAPDLAQFGFRFPQMYREIGIDPSLFDWAGERDRQAKAFREWRRQMPRAVRRHVGEPAVLAAGRNPCRVPFSRLSLTAQLEVLAQPVEVSWRRCATANRFLVRWRERARAGRLEVSSWPRSASRWLGGAAYARRFLELAGLGAGRRPVRDAGRRAQQALLDRKLRAENIYPLLWRARL